MNCTQAKKKVSCFWYYIFAKADVIASATRLIMQVYVVSIILLQTEWTRAESEEQERMG